MRAGQRAWATAFAVVMATTTAATVGGCGSCDMGCGPTPDASDVERVELVAVDLRPDDRTVVFETADGAERLVKVNGRIEALDEGTTYLVPIDGAGWSALPDPCDCGGPYITDLDGEVVDTAYFATVRSLDLAWITAAVVGIGVTIIGGWALVRRRRGLPL